MHDGFVRPLTAEQKRLPPELYDEFFGRDRPPMAGNVALLEALDQTALLEFRGQRYRVPPVPFLAGLRLNEALNQFEQLARSSTGLEGLTAVRDAFRALIDRMVPLVEPVGMVHGPSVWRRLLAALRLRRRPDPPPHPFYDASVQEVAELLAFFGVRSRTSSVRSPSRTTRHPAPSTSGRA